MNDCLALLSYLASGGSQKMRAITKATGIPPARVRQFLYKEVWVKKPLSMFLKYNKGFLKRKNMFSGDVRYLGNGIVAVNISLFRGLQTVAAIYGYSIKLRKRKKGDCQSGFCDVVYHPRVGKEMIEPPFIEIEDEDDPEHPEFNQTSNEPNICGDKPKYDEDNNSTDEVVYYFPEPENISD